jgi:hypothetical protein
MQPHDDGSGPVHSHQGRTEDQSFDALAKGLANGSISRGRAIKLMGTALLGGVLASIPGLAWAHHRPDHGLPPGHGGTPPGHGGTPPGQGSPPPPPPPPPGACTPGSCPEGTGDFPVCNNNPDCICFQTAEGGSLCFDIRTDQSCELYQQCTTSLDCPTGHTCVVNNCCDVGICIAPAQLCPTTENAGLSAESQQSRRSSGSGQRGLTASGR